MFLGQPHSGSALYNAINVIYLPEVNKDLMCGGNKCVNHDRIIFPKEESHGGLYLPHCNF